jgi:pimeloyl-ACP methyl ester carboxylesterase
VDLCSFLTIGLMLGAVTPCTADTPRNEIEAALVTFATAFNKGDGAAVAAHYVEDAAVLRSQHVTTEGDRLYVEVRGEAMNHPDCFAIRQESRDAVAVLRVAGETQASVFGNSSGAVIALDMAASQPQAVTAVIAHEPPLARLHPDSAKWQAFFQDVLQGRRQFGRTVAMLRFTFGIGVDFTIMRAAAAIRTARRAQKSSPAPYLDRRKVIDHFLCQEMLPVSHPCWN